MNLVIKLLWSPLFWVDIFLAIIGGLIVYWGLRVEKNAEKLLPPTDFNLDIFGDIKEKQQAEIDRGWKILMTGIVVEVIAALLISIISGLEVANANEKSASANLEAKQAEKAAGDARELAVITESNNLVLQTNVLELKIALGKIQARNINLEQSDAFINFLKNRPNKHPVKVYVIERDFENDYETRTYAIQIRKLLDGAGYGAKDDEIVKLPNVRWESSDYVNTRSPMGPFELVVFGDGSNLHWPGVEIINQTNPPGVMVYHIGNDKSCLADIIMAFSSIDVNPTIHYYTQTFVTKEGEWSVFIPPKF